MSNISPLGGFTSGSGSGSLPPALIIAASQNIIVPAGVGHALVQVVGGGGGGGGGGSALSSGGVSNQVAGSGGGAGTSMWQIVQVVPGESLPAVIGAGGAGGTGGAVNGNPGGNGTAGGTSTLTGTHFTLTANGGGWGGGSGGNSTSIPPVGFPGLGPLGGYEFGASPSSAATLPGVGGAGRTDNGFPSVPLDGASGGGGGGPATTTKGGKGGFSGPNQASVIGPGGSPTVNGTMGGPGVLPGDGGGGGGAGAPTGGGGAGGTGSAGVVAITWLP